MQFKLKINNSFIGICILETSTCFMTRVNWVMKDEMVTRPVQ